MAIGWHIETLLSAGSTSALTTEIYDGELPQQGTYPGVEISDFSDSEACKDGEGKETYTVTLIAWGDYKSDLDDIIDAAKVDLIGAPKYANGVQLGIKFEGRQPWLRDEEKKKWGRPADFIVLT